MKKRGFLGSQSPKKINITNNDNSHLFSKNVSPIRSPIVPNSATIKKDQKIKSKIDHSLITESNAKQISSNILTNHGITKFRPFSGVINAKKVIKNHLNKMLGNINESTGEDLKNKKFDGIFIVKLDVKIFNGPIDLNCLIYKEPKKIKQDLMKILTGYKILFKNSFVRIYLTNRHIHLNLCAKRTG
jgi:hypothetical protein